MAVTIQDIAQHLKIAPSTVSKALNNYPHISAEMRARVFAASDELGYVPSAAARNLRRKRTDKIGFAFSVPVPLMSDYVSGIIIGAVAAAEQHGYNLTLYPSNDNQVQQLTQLSRAREVDGLLVLSGRAQMEQRLLPALQKGGVPFVVVGRRVGDELVSFVKADDPTGAYAVTQHLIEQGHQRIGFTTRPASGITSRDRYAGYQRAMRDAGLAIDETLIVPTSFEPESGYRAMMTLLDRPKPPTAVFAIHDLVAIECLRAATDHGLRVPDDIAIAGFDNWRASLATQPPLTTVQPPLSAMGEQAMQALLNRIADPLLPAVRTTLPVELIVRQSTMA